MKLKGFSTDTSCLLLLFAALDTFDNVGFVKVFVIFAICVLLSKFCFCLAREGEWSAAIVSGWAGQSGRRRRRHGQAGPWGKDVVSLQPHVPGQAEPDKGPCAIPRLGFGSLALLWRFSRGRPLTHNARTLPRCALATSDQFHTAGALGGGFPGYWAALRLTEAAGAAAGPAAIPPERSIPPAPLPAGPGPAPHPARREPHAAGPVPRGLWLAARAGQ